MKIDKVTLLIILLAVRIALWIVEINKIHIIKKKIVSKIIQKM